MGFSEKEGKRKGHEKIFEEEIVKISLKWEKEQTPKMKNPSVSHRDKTKRKHVKTHINQNKNKQTNKYTQ